MLKKLFLPGKLVHWQVQEKKTIDEVISKTIKVRNRLMLELMAVDQIPLFLAKLSGLMVISPIGTAPNPTALT